MEIPRWALPVAALATSGMLLLTGCGGDSGAKKNASSKQKVQADQLEDPAADPNADGDPLGATLEVSSDPKLGKIVVDGEGRTLYRFDKDTAKPPASSCVAACAKAWPPVTTKDEAAVKGLNSELVGKVKRADGTWQVTLNGWPLYRFAKDQQPGDTLGQGVGGTWFASTTTGKKAGAPTAAAPPPQAGRWAGWLVLKAKQDDKLGTIVTDGKGRTLYRFDKDTAKPSVSNCNGACAKAWPPVKYTKKMKLTGVDKSQIGNIMTKDGICQATINGWPIYRYAKDQQPDDTLGQGVGGTWFVVTPEGKKALGSGSGGGGGDDGGYGNGGGGYGNGGGGY